MKIYFDAIDPEYMDYEAEVVRCVLQGDTINITFRAKEENKRVEGRVSLKATSTEQTTTGHWRYPANRFQVQRFAEATHPKVEDEIMATVTGRLKNFRGKKVLFQGKWEDLPEGPAYEFEIQAEIS